MTTLRTGARDPVSSTPPAFRPSLMKRVAIVSLAAAFALGGLALTSVPVAAQDAAKKATPPSAQQRTRGAAAPAAPEETVMLNFQNADLEAVVRAIGQFTGRQFVIDPRVKGTVSLSTERPVTRQQAYEQLLSALRLQGFTIVESGAPGGISRILPEADAKLQGGRVIAPSAEAPRGDQIVTQIFRLRYESATAMVPILRPLIAPNNTISANPSNNSLVITDYADNLRRIERIIAAIDSPSSAQVEIVPLKYGLAVEIATIANRILDEGARAAGQAVDGGQRVQVLAESRTNSLIIRAASAARVQLARQLIEQLDQPSVTPGNINVVYLRNADAVKLAPLLRAIVSSDPSFVPQAGSTGGLSPSTGQPAFGAQPGAPTAAAPAAQATFAAASTASSGAGGGGQLGGMIQADAATNSLIITAPEPLYRNLRATIEKLDARRAQVVIESLIVEVTADKAAELGVQFQALGGLRESNSNNTSVIGGTNFGGAGQNIIGAAQNLGSLGPGLNLGVIRGTVNIPGIGEVTNLGFLARALETNANANVLSRPNIQVLDNEEAKFLVGQNVPFITGSFTQGQTTGATNPFQTFERRDVGLQLRVKPQISEGGSVKLAIYVEVSSVVPGTTGGQLITNKRSFESMLLVEDGSFVVLSGLIEDKGNDSVSKIPLLGDIPFIGALFRYENRSRTKTNTMVFLKPIVLRDESASFSLAADRYEYMRTEMSDARKPDNLIFRGFENPGVPPAPQQRPQPAPAAPQSVAPPSATPAASIAAPAPAATSPGGSSTADATTAAAAPQTAAPSGSPSAPSAAAPVTAAPTPAPVAAAPASTTATQPLAPAAAAAARPASGAFAASAGARAPSMRTQLVQVIALTDVAKGREIQRQLRAAGFDAYWESVKSDRGADSVRVRVAVDRATQSVAAVIADLKRRGFEPTLVTQ
jgi:general secretion pathway protein D